MANGQDRPVNSGTPPKTGDRCGFILSLFAFILVMMMNSAGAYAQCSDARGGVAGSPCDCQYWDTLKARAWLEAEREVVQNQNLIFKPDSVLEYVCFDSIEKEKVRHAGALFSDNTGTWGTARGCGANCLDIAMQDVTHKALLAYLQANFGHDYLGHRWHGAGGAPGSPSIIGGGDYVCEAMIRVWEKAKCYNFMTEAPDGFMFFEDYITSEPRRYPDPCETDPRWQNFLDIALEDPPWFQESQPVNEEVFTTVREKILPGACTAAISTGIPVNPQGNRNAGFTDAFCTNPGCTFNGNACAAN